MKMAKRATEETILPWQAEKIINLVVFRMKERAIPAFKGNKGNRTSSSRETEDGASFYFFIRTYGKRRSAQVEFNSTKQLRARTEPRVESESPAIFSEYIFKE